MLLLASPACAQEAWTPVPASEVYDEATIAAMLDDTAKRGGRGPSPWKADDLNTRRLEWMTREPPAPPLQDDACDAFDGGDLIEVKLASDYSPVPYGLMLPPGYAWSGFEEDYRRVEVEGVFLMKAWQHDFAPFSFGRTKYSSAKTPGDDMSFLVRGGGGGPGDALDLFTRRFAAPDAFSVEGPGYDLQAAAERAGFDDEMGAWRIRFHRHIGNAEAGIWIAFHEDGSVSDLINCGVIRVTGQVKATCNHEMAFADQHIGLKATYDVGLATDWRRLRALTERFFGCARAAYLAEREEDRDHADL